MKYFAIILVLLLVALSACSSQQLPPEPVTPSSVGNYYKAVGEWAVEPLSFTLASPEQISCYAGNLVPITGFVTGDDFVYKNYYVWSQSLQGWYSDTYDSGDVVESTNWIRGDASFSDSILCEDLLEYADSNGEIYVVAYACSWDGSDWDCYDNKWQIQVFQVTEIAAPTCVDSDGGIEYTTQGSVVTNTETATDFCSGSSLTEYSCSPTNTLESILYTCPDGCSAGECLPAAPVEPTGPSVTGVTFRTQSGSLITELTDGMTIDVSSYGSNIFNARADIVNTNRVTFALSGPLTISRTENVATYDLFGDGAGNIPSQGFSNGAYTLVVTPINTSSGVTGTSVSIDFTLTGIGSTPNPNPDPNPIVGDGGLFWDSVLLAEWQKRAQNGPYVNKGDAFTNSPDDWQRITQSSLEFNANPTSGRMLDNEDIDLDSNYSEVRYHESLKDAAFYALVTDNQEIKTKVKTELLWHARQDYLQAPTNYRYQDYGNIDQVGFAMFDWFQRLIVTTDLIRDEFSYDEWQEMRDWLVPYAYIAGELVHQPLKDSFPQRYSRNYDDKSARALSPSYNNQYTHKTSDGELHNKIPSLARMYNNRKTDTIVLSGFAGVMFNDTVLIDRTKIYFEEFLKYGVFPDGAVGEAHRNYDKPSTVPSLGSVLYQAGNLQFFITFAHALSTSGDYSMYEYSTCDGLWGTEVGDGGNCDPGETPKSLKFLIYTHLDLIEGQKIWYNAVVDLSSSNKEQYRLDNIAPDGRQWNNDVYITLANLYYKDDRIKQGYMRQNPGSPDYDLSMVKNTWNEPLQTGQNAIFPSLLFMYGNMENVQPPKSEGGLFWNDALVAAWKNRAQNGPYVNKGDAFTNSPGDWSRIERNAQTFMSNPGADRLGNTASNRIAFKVKNQADISGKEMTSIMPMDAHIDMKDAALYALVTNDNAMMQAIRTELLWHATQSHLQAPTNPVITTDTITDRWHWVQSEYFTRMVVITDLISPILSESDMETIGNWMLPWAHIFEEMVDLELSRETFDNRVLGEEVPAARDYETGLKGRATSADFSRNDYTHQDFSGIPYNKISSLHRMWNNRKNSMAYGYGLIGIMFDDAKLIDRTKLIFEEWLKYHIFPDGQNAEAHRSDASNVRRGHLFYGASDISAYTHIGFALNNKYDDDFFFTYSTCDGLHGSECTSGDSPKSLRTVITSYMDMMEKKIDVYWFNPDSDSYYGKAWNSLSTSQKEDFRIDLLRDEVSSGSKANQQWNTDTSFLPAASVIYDDSRMALAYKRLGGGPSPYASNLDRGKGSEGRHNQFPGLLFMYADLEGLVN